MVEFAKRIRERARELGLSDAEVARRAGISERRYGYYATGEREPNLDTLVRICDVLAVTPNDMLLGEGPAAGRTPRDRLQARITAAAGGLTNSDLEVAVCQLECFLSVRPSRRARGARTATT